VREVRAEKSPKKRSKRMHSQKKQRSRVERDFVRQREGENQVGPEKPELSNTKVKKNGANLQIGSNDRKKHGERKSKREV